MTTEFDKIMQIEVHSATPSHISSMVALSDLKRQAYEKAQPQFWKRSKNANEIQFAWFEELLTRDDHILLVAEAAEDQKVKGFIIGKLINAPEVYEPGGSNNRPLFDTLVIDDFCVGNPALWGSVGAILLHKCEQKGKDKGAKQILVVCGHHDESKRSFLMHNHLTIASEWYVKGLP